MSHILIFAPSLLGFAALALAMERHQQDLFGLELSAHASRSLRLLGTLALLAALALAVRSMGWGLGLVSYSGHTGAAAGAVFISLFVFVRWRARQ